MRQVVQRPRDGEVRVEEVPPPALRPGWLLVSNRYSLLSAGTERRKLDLGSKNLVQKARARPDLVRKVVDRARVEGVRSTISTVRDRLDTLAPIGYSSAGVVKGVGEGVVGLAPGDRVACGGQWAGHAEIVAVPRNLVARVPEGVDLADAAYATVGAIAIHAVRQAEAGLGERIGVIGLGLVGQLCVRVLAAAGCDALGIDLDPEAVSLARAAGAQAYGRDDPALEASVLARTGSLGLDAVLICAQTSSPDPLALAARLARTRGRLVVVGDVPISVDRDLLYEKELELRLSRSYGAGRYDADYEERGRELPAEYVRWTEQRNIQAFVDLVDSGRVDPSQLTTHRFPVERAPEAYAALGGDGGRAFGVLLEYPEDAARPERRPVAQARAPRGDGARIGLIGAGAFARGTLLPALAQAGAELVAVTSEGGLSAADVATRYGFERTAGSVEELLADEGVTAVVIATRHATHAELAVQALRAGKAVFVEKPLALSREELAEVEAALALGSILMVGFNRRYAPLTERLREAFASAPGAAFTARVNAGPLPHGHWLNDPEDGGGRLLGEGCHFVDLLAHLAGGPPLTAFAAAVPQADRPVEGSETLTGILRFAGGSTGTLVYAGAGDPRLPKERIEAFGAGTSAVLDDFRRLELYRNGDRSVTKSAQDKGHRAEIAAFVAAAAGRAEPPDPRTYLDSTAATLALAESLRSGLAVDVR